MSITAQLSLTPLRQVCVFGVCFSLWVCFHTRLSPEGKTGAYREMLEQPRPHDVSGHLGENATLFLPLLVLVGIIVVPRAGRCNAVV